MEASGTHRLGRAPSPIRWWEPIAWIVGAAIVSYAILALVASGVLGTAKAQDPTNSTLIYPPNGIPGFPADTCAGDPTLAECPPISAAVVPNWMLASEQKVTSWTPNDVLFSKDSDALITGAQSYGPGVFYKDTKQITCRTGTTEPYRYAGAGKPYPVKARGSSECTAPVYHGHTESLAKLNQYGYFDGKGSNHEERTNQNIYVSIQRHCVNTNVHYWRATALGFMISRGITYAGGHRAFRGVKCGA